jgi:hypothetical protein
MLNGDAVDEVVVVLVVVGLVVVVVVVVGLVVVVVVVVVGHDPMSHAFTPKGLLDGSQISFLRISPLTERQIMDCLAIPNPHETEH